MTTRTKLSFPSSRDIWPEVERWSKHENAELKSSSESERLYQKGGLMTAPLMYKFRQAGGEVAVEAWIPSTTFQRACSFFILPPEMGVESGGVKAAVIRKVARQALNQLLHQLGAPLVQ
jgi:hypothetical protein